MKSRGGKKREIQRKRKRERERKNEKGWERGPGERMWREIYPKAPGNHNPRAISIIDSTRFKTPSVDLPLVPLVRWVVGGRPPPRAFRTLLCAVRFFLFPARWRTRRLSRWEFVVPADAIRDLSDWMGNCRHLPCFFRDVHLGVQPLDYSADNILHDEINRNNEITRFPKVTFCRRKKLVIRLMLIGLIIVIKIYALESYTF